MKTFGRVVLAAACAYVAAGCAGTKEATKDVQDIVPGVSQTETGLIQIVGRNQISVVGSANAGQPVTYNIGPKTIVIRGSERVEVSQLEPGTPVRVAFESTAGPEHATKIEVLTGAEADQVRNEVNGTPGSKY
jgi:hypothetical protein